MPLKNPKLIEIGSAHYGALMPLLDKNWYQSAQKTVEDGSNRFPAELLSCSGQWEGYFVEPAPMRFAKLIENNKHRSNAHFIQGALASKSIFTEMPVFGRNSIPGGSLVFYHSQRKLHYNIILQTFTLDDLLDFLDFTPTLLFIDIEGSEMGVLETYSFSRLPDFWMVDMHHNARNIQKAIQIFEKNGYKILTTTGHPKDKDELWVQRRI